MNFSVALFGSCFTFNTEYNEKKDEAAGKRVSSLTGPSFGLNLILELDLFNYLKGNITKHTGARLVIHDPGKWPLVAEYGINVKPDTYTLTAITQTELTREEEPYPSNCTKHWSRTIYEELAQNFVNNETIKVDYSLALCQRMCLLDIIADKCQCIHPLYTDFDLFKNYLEATYEMEICNLIQESLNEKCISGILLEFDKGTRSCPCNVGCKETEYEVKISSAILPTPNNDLEGIKDENGTVSETTNSTQPKESFAEIGVYFQSLNKKLVYEEPKYTLTGSMIAALGGSMSLYLGISISMLFEVFELLIDLLIAIFTFCAGH